MRNRVYVLCTVCYNNLMSNTTICTVLANPSISDQVERSDAVENEIANLGLDVVSMSGSWYDNEYWFYFEVSGEISEFDVPFEVELIQG